MRAMKNSPLFRIALLSFAVLLAHTSHAATRPVVPVSPPSSSKVAAAQPDPQKKLIPGIKRIATPRDRAPRHTLFGGSLGLTSELATTILSAHRAGEIAAARRAVYIPPQRLPFALRI
jgi:hypothetical protein